jgi:hypothetical protein
MAFRTHAQRRDAQSDRVDDRANDLVDDDAVIVAEPVEHRSAVVDSRTHEFPPWSPAQIIGLIAGLGMTVLGIAAVARTGFDTADVYQPQLDVWGLPHSPLLGVFEIAFGALLIFASIIPGGLRWLMALLGVISLGFGIVILADAATSDLTRWFGVDDSNGWLFTIVGSVVLLTAMLAPVFSPHRAHEVVDVRETTTGR